MIQIRKSVFETNSSSSHSLVISKKDRGYDYDLPVDENGTLVIPFGWFEWGPEILKTPMEKLSYKVTDLMGRCDTWHKPPKEIYKMIDENKEIQKVVHLIKHHCPQVKEVVFKLHDDSTFPCGDIDHESWGTSNGVETKRLIFDNSVIIVIDNDNDCHFYDYVDHRGWSDNEATKNSEDLFDKPLGKLKMHRWED